MGIHFIDPGSPVAIVLDAILSAAGPNFSAPFDSAAQPHDIVSANVDPLIQYQMPGGSQLEGHANPGSGGDIGAAINSMLGLLSPAISAYALILPIIGVIRGIIEILCCMMNPFCVIPAIIRLFVKWIPPFISLFPPLAGVVIIISTIKAIIAIIFYILTEIIPFIELMIDNIKTLAVLFENRDDLNESQVSSAEEKLRSLLATLIQKLGILAVFKPLLDLIFLILGLVSGFPCGAGGNEDGDCGNTKESNASTGSLNQSAIGFNSSTDDAAGCQDPICPDILSDRDNTPRGSAVLIRSSFGDCAPAFIFKLVTGNSEVSKLEQFQESSGALDCQLDEPVKLSRPAGSSGDRSSLKVKISDRRGESRSFTVPVLDISGTNIKISSQLGFLFVNRLVDYEIIPDYEMLVHQGIIGIGCHPDVRNVKDEISKQFPNLGESAVDSNPEAASLQEDYAQLINDVDGCMRCVSGCIDLVEGNEPPFDNATDCLSECESDCVDLLNENIADLTSRLNAIIGRNISSSASTFEVDKTSVRADDTDIAIITVTPRDVTGALLLKNSPNGVNDGVEVLTDLGVVSNTQLDGPTGTVTAEIKSPVIGRATLSVKINNELIVDADGINDPVTRTRVVNFVAEDVLPVRRKRSKASGKTAVNTGTTSETEPGSR